MAALCFIGYSSANAQAGRYLSEVFPDAQKAAGVVYSYNYQFLTGAPVKIPLAMDVYTPSGVADPVTERPLVIYLHTGSFLPTVINSNPTGNRGDSTVAEMCRQFARRGYVAAAASYRLGWNPTSGDLDVRKGSLLQAVYRAIIDVKSCVRYFNRTAANGNPYGVDTTKIILAGQGTGGYIALAYASLDDAGEISLTKFLSQTTNPAYGFTAGQSYVNQAIWGNFDGTGGAPGFNVNDPDTINLGYGTDIHFAFNMGGAIGDSSWLEAGDVPMVAFHVTNDPFAPYGDGPVFVPTNPPQYVVDVSGSQTVVRLANQLGNNACFASAGFTDPYTQRANAINGGWEGLFPLERPVNPLTGLGEAGPWEWFDSTSLQGYAQLIGLPAQAGQNAYNNGLLTNPDMSKAKGMAYIDTIQNYVNPRIALCLSLPTGLNNEILASNTNVYPNPATDVVTIQLPTGVTAKRVTMTDLMGRVVINQLGNELNKVSIVTTQLNAGMYTIQLVTSAGSVAKKVTIQ
jgi:hypothetical protein